MPAIVIAATVVLLVVVAVVLARQGHPERAAASGDPETGPDDSSRLYRGVDRPAGPGAESEGVVGAGDLAPGGSETLPS